MVTFDLLLHTRASLHTDGEPDQWVSHYHGIIVSEDDDGVAKVVGRVHAYRLNALLAAEHGEPLFDVCDSHSQELHVLHTLLYERDGYRFRDFLFNHFEATEPDLLVIDYVVLHPKWRGLKLGLLAVRRLVDLVGAGCGLAVADIAALRRDAHQELHVPAKWIPAQAGKEAWRDSTLKLRRHFRQLGFVRLGRTPFYVLPLAQGIPTAQELIAPRTPRE